MPQDAASWTRVHFVPVRGTTSGLLAPPTEGPARRWARPQIGPPTGPTRLRGSSPLRDWDGRRPPALLVSLLLSRRQETELRSHTLLLFWNKIETELEKKRSRKNFWNLINLVQTLSLGDRGKKFKPLFPHLRSRGMIIQPSPHVPRCEMKQLGVYGSWRSKQ